MFCPKCGTSNTETGKFCRSCGTDLGNITAALSGHLPQQQPAVILDQKGKPIDWQSAITKFSTGLAFLVVSLVLSMSRMGRAWWFWLLIPAFIMIGTGIAQYIQLKKLEAAGQTPFRPAPAPEIAGSPVQAELPSAVNTYVSPESRYKTGDLAPPSVTDGTTRHLEVDREGQTMTLPKDRS